MATTSAPLKFEVGTPLFYVVVGAGGIMSILLLVILVLCVAIGCLVARKRRTYTVAAQPPEPGEQGRNEEGQTPNQQQQLQGQPQGNNDTYIHALMTEPILEFVFSHIRTVVNSEVPQQQNTYDIQNPEYDVIQERGKLNALVHNSCLQ